MRLGSGTPFLFVFCLSLFFAAFPLDCWESFQRSVSPIHWPLGCVSDSCFTRPRGNARRPSLSRPPPFKMVPFRRNAQLLGCHLKRAARGQWCRQSLLPTVVHVLRRTREEAAFSIYQFCCSPLFPNDQGFPLVAFSFEPRGFLSPAVETGPSSSSGQAALTSPSVLRDIFTGCVMLGGLFSFSTLKISFQEFPSCHSGNESD